MGDTPVHLEYTQRLPVGAMKHKSGDISFMCLPLVCEEGPRPPPLHRVFGTRVAAEGFGSFPPGGGWLAWVQKEGGEDMRACRRETILSFGCWLDDGSEML